MSRARNGIINIRLKYSQILDIKLSDYAKLAGISYQTAWRMWKRGELNAYQQRL
jgi:hypothetical protein